MSTEHVEARSLAALNQLAANPPKYPTKPNDIKQDPLTLYISRVPGTRDVILSTQKPQIKNVTAEDVASSLYYVHFQTPEDAPLSPMNQARQPVSPRSSSESTMPRIHRKPLPNTSAHPAAGLPPTIPAVPSSNGNHAMSDHRTPLGPNLPLAETTGRQPPLLPNTSRSLAYEQSHHEEHPSALPARPRDSHAPSGLADAPPLTTDYSTNTQFGSPSKQRPFTPFSLTLIRRDPSSGGQWNVGKIASFQLENPDLIDDEKHRQPSPSIQIHLETSGYAKFRGMPVGPELGLPPPLDLRPGSSASSMRQFHSAMMNTSTSGAFERQVQMTYSPSFTANLRKHFKGRRSVDEGHPVSPNQRPAHFRNNSQTSIGSFGGDFDGGDAPMITQPAAGLKPRGYVFFSPWNGRCEFLTGRAGRSLKCRHVLPNYGGGVYNPLVEGADPEHAEEKVDNIRPISELRFNLPSNELLAEKKSTEGGARARDQIHSQFNKMMAKAQGFEGSDEDEYNFDLSLGREKAGGGNRGKRAKMGKLIILDEGLKMLDLAVAANVGIWWTTWERTY